MLGDKQMQRAWMAYADANEVPHDHEDEEPFKYGYDAGRSSAAQQWVKIEGPETLPKRSKHYWITRPDGKVKKAAFYVGAFDDDAIAWMPDDPPSPYTDPREGGADDERTN